MEGVSREFAHANGRHRDIYEQEFNIHLFIASSPKASR